jgi:hypothetical protein
MLVIPSLTENQGYLWVLGGRGANSQIPFSIQLYNDIW